MTAADITNLENAEFKEAFDYFDKVTSLCFIVNFGIIWSDDWVQTVTILSVAKLSCCIHAEIAWRFSLVFVISRQLPKVH